MRIALLYLGRRGGITHYSAELADALSGACDLSCHLSASNSLADRFSSLPCPVTFYPTYSSWPSFILNTVVLRRVMTIARRLLAEQPDYVLDTGSGPWADLICHLTGSKLRWLRVIHDVTPHEDRLRPLVTLQRHILPLNASAFITLSQFSAQQLRRRFSSASVIASRHGLILQTASPNIMRVAGQRKHLLFFGRIEPYKGITCLLAAFERVKAIDPQITLTIAGPGNLPPADLRIASLLGATILNEWLADNVVTELLQKAGVLVLPYLSATQSGVAAAGISHALPTIASDVGALPEQVIDGYNGRIVPPGDSTSLANAILSITGSDNEARRMAENALRLRTQEYKWDTIARDLIQQVDDLTPSHKMAA